MRSTLASGQSSGSRGIVARISLANSLGMGAAPSAVDGPLAAAESTSIDTAALEHPLVASLQSLELEQSGHR